MSAVNVMINGKNYRMACDDGQEDHLIKLARELDEKIARLREAFGEVGDTRLTVMAAITISDDLSECKRRIRGLEQEMEGLKEARIASVERVDAIERESARGLERAAERIERLAHALNGAAAAKSTTQ
jgi:cell division protein ZapA